MLLWQPKTRYKALEATADPFIIFFQSAKQYRQTVRDLCKTKALINWITSVVEGTITFVCKPICADPKN